MSIFKRLFKIGQAEAHSAINHLEDPIKITEQGIRDLKGNIDKSLHALAEVKALAIRAKSDFANYSDKAEDYEKKAMLLLQRASKGEMDSADSDRLASEALIKKEENLAHSKRCKEEEAKFENSVANLEQNIKALKSNLSKWENELKTLTARVKVSNATMNLNKQLAQLDASGTVAMLERMKDKVVQDEALSEAYGMIANESKTVDDEIDKALDKGRINDAASALADLKSKMGLEESK
ncbi:MAG: PspA/IM30 family protein [Bacteroidota bacterium]|nr:PspA/IM30 family protein [Bacteroidota bacterium]